MNNILSLLENYTLENADYIALKLAKDFRTRRIEKNTTREQLAEKSGIAVSNIIRFEQKGLISLKNLICIAMALEYTAEIKKYFCTTQILHHGEIGTNTNNSGKKKV